MFRRCSTEVYSDPRLDAELQRFTHVGSGLGSAVEFEGLSQGHRTLSGNIYRIFRLNNSSQGKR